MFKKVVLLTGILVCFSTPAMSEDGRPYVSAHLGMTQTSDSDLSDSGTTGDISFDSGYALGAAVGTDLGRGRIEGEIAYKAADIDEVTIDGLGSASINGDVSALTFMVNGYYDFDTSSGIKPFVMGGIGMASLAIESSDIGADEDDQVFAYQVGAGIGIDLSKQATLDLSYRYMGTSDPDFNGTEATYDSHNFLAGMRFNF